MNDNIDTGSWTWNWNLYTVKNSGRWNVETAEKPKRNWRRRIRNLACFTFGLGSVLFWVTQPLTTVSGPRSAPLIEVDTERLETHVRILTDDMAPRNFEHFQNMEKTADYIQEQFEGAGARISELSYEVNGKMFRIVSGFYGPDTKERIIVGAHYDAVPGSPGADDNASGVAGLLEMAAALGETPPPMQVELVAYPNEEPPFFRSRLMGSYVHAMHLREKKVAVRLMIALESIGYFSDKPFTQLYPNPFFRLLYPSRANFIAVVSRLREGPAVRRIKKTMRTVPDMSVYSFNGPSIIAGIDYSDHRSYWKAGYRAVMVTDTAFYRNDRYHSSGDTADSIDYTRLSKVVQGVYAAVLAEAR